MSVLLSLKYSYSSRRSFFKPRARAIGCRRSVHTVSETVAVSHCRVWICSVCESAGHLACSIRSWKHIILLILTKQIPIGHPSERGNSHGQQRA